MTPCVELDSDINSNGYPRVRRNGRRWLAHRLAWVDAFGSIPEGIVVRHRCDNRRCANVEHLELGSQSDNVQDCISRGRHVSSPGERNGMAKLTDAEAEQIKTAYAAGGVRQVDLARQYGVTQPLISMIVNGKARA